MRRIPCVTFTVDPPEFHITDETLEETRLERWVWREVFSQKYFLLGGNTSLCDQTHTTECEH